MSGSGISWAICKSAPRSRQITMPVPHHSVFTGRMPFLPPNQQRQSTEGKVTEGTERIFFRRKVPKMPGINAGIAATTPLLHRRTCYAISPLACLRTHSSHCISNVPSTAAWTATVTIYAAFWDKSTFCIQLVFVYSSTGWL